MGRLYLLRFFSLASCSSRSLDEGGVHYGQEGYEVMSLVRLFAFRHTRAFGIRMDERGTKGKDIKFCFPSFSRSPLSLVFRNGLRFPT